MTQAETAVDPKVYEFDEEPAPAPASSPATTPAETEPAPDQGAAPAEVKPAADDQAKQKEEEARQAALALLNQVAISVVLRYLPADGNLAGRQVDVGLRLGEGSPKLLSFRESELGPLWPALVTEIEQLAVKQPTPIKTEAKPTNPAPASAPAKPKSQPAPAASKPAPAPKAAAPAPKPAGPAPAPAKPVQSQMDDLFDIFGV